MFGPYMQLVQKNKTSSLSKLMTCLDANLFDHGSVLGSAKHRAMITFIMTIRVTRIENKILNKSVVWENVQYDESASKGLKWCWRHVHWEWEWESGEWMQVTWTHTCMELNVLNVGLMLWWVRGDMGGFEYVPMPSPMGSIPINPSLHSIPP